MSVLRNPTVDDCIAEVDAWGASERDPYAPTPTLDDIGRVLAAEVRRLRSRYEPDGTAPALTISDALAIADYPDSLEHLPSDDLRRAIVVLATEIRLLDGRRDR